jgi:hypothetical protein
VHDKIKGSNTSYRDHDGNEGIVKNALARFVCHEMGQNCFHRRNRLASELAKFTVPFHATVVQTITMSTLSFVAKLNCALKFYLNTTRRDSLNEPFYCRNEPNSRAYHGHYADFRPMLLCSNVKL